MNRLLEPAEGNLLADFKLAACCRGASGSVLIGWNGDRAFNVPACSQNEPPPRCSSADPCEKLMRAMSTPARKTAMRISGLSVAGPSVATMRVRRLHIAAGNPLGRRIERAVESDQANQIRMLPAAVACSLNHRCSGYRRAMCASRSSRRSIRFGIRAHFAGTQAVAVVLILRGNSPDLDARLTAFLIHVERTFGCSPLVMRRGSLPRGMPYFSFLRCIGTADAGNCLLTLLQTLPDELRYVIMVFIIGNLRKRSDSLDLLYQLLLFLDARSE